MVLYFCSNVLGSLTFVNILIVFRATRSILFSVILSTVVCIPLYLTFNLSFTISIALDFALVSFCVGRLCLSGSKSFEVSALSY